MYGFRQNSTFTTTIVNTVKSYLYATFDKVCSNNNNILVETFITVEYIAATWVKS